MSSMLLMQNENDGNTLLHYFIKEDFLPGTIWAFNNLPIQFTYVCKMNFNCNSNRSDANMINSVKNHQGMTILQYTAYYLAIDHMKILIQYDYILLSEIDSNNRTFLHIFLRRLKTYQIEDKRHGDTGIYNHSRKLDIFNIASYK